MSAVSRIRAAVGLPAPSALETARAKRESAQADHERETSKLADLDAEIGRLTKAFEEVDPSETLADQIVSLKDDRAKRQLYVDRSASLFRTAQRSVLDLELAEQDARLAELEAAANTDTLVRSIEADWAKRGEPAIAALLAVMDDAERAVTTAQAAAREAYRLRGDANAEFKIMGQYPQLTKLAWLAGRETFDVRRRLLALFG